VETRRCRAAVIVGIRIVTVGNSYRLNGNTMVDNKQMSESFWTATSLALVGGFLETYTFMLHGHVFANAQTGNIALCGMALAEADWVRALKYAIPVAAFALGVATVEWVRNHWPSTRMHWRQSVVLVESTLLCGCFFLHGVKQDMLANLLVSIACALQVQTFRKVRGTSYASTMCTGNLRSATVAWIAWNRTRKLEVRQQAMNYFGIISVFLMGAAMAFPLVRVLSENAIAIPISLLIVVSLLMSLRPVAAN